MRLVIFGPQGPAKERRARASPRSTASRRSRPGEIFRWAIKGQTALGLKVSQYVDAGRLVPTS